VDIPVTIKCRLGVDDQDPRRALWSLVDDAASAGCTVFLVHARKAWLQGLSPKENRDIPPLDYALVYELKEAFPELEIVLNGGINTINECRDHLQYVDGVMMGREAYSNPYVLASVDSELYQESVQVLSRDEVLERFVEYVQSELENGVRLNQMSRHAVGLFHGEPRSRLWRRHISEQAHRPGANADVLRDAYQQMIGTTEWRQVSA
jgi:tRNA-dihydrouridine synthase A